MGNLLFAETLTDVKESVVISKTPVMENIRQVGLIIIFTHVKALLVILPAFILWSEPLWVTKSIALSVFKWWTSD